VEDALPWSWPEAVAGGCDTRIPYILCFSSEIVLMVVFQTWLSSLDISKFLAGIDGVDVVNDGTIDKVLGDQKDDIMPIPNDNEGFATAFLKSLAMSARLAASRKTTLVVMVFAPITPEQDICLDLGQKRIYLTTERIFQTILDAVGNVQLPVILVTPSPFTGGWLCRPSFLNPSSYPSPDKMMQLLAKSCGGAFADRFISSFTDRSTPFLTEPQREKVKYDDPMPLRASVLQVDCLHRFQRQIHESLEHRLSVFARDHSFILEPEAAKNPSSFSDSWTQYGPRHGRSMEVWAEHWGIPPPTVNDANRFKFLGEAFGGTKESQFFHLKYLAAIELETYPGDWTRHVGGTSRELFTSFWQRLMPSEDDVKRVFDAVEFRASSIILAQVVAKAFGLPLPDGVKCRYWHDKTDGVSDEYYRKLQYAFACALPLFGQVAVLPSEKRHEYKDVRFLRSARWLAAATALRFENASGDDIEKFMLNDVARFIAKLRDTQKMLLLEDQAVKRRGLNWVAALGLGGEVQLTPTKTATPEPKIVQPTEDVGFFGRNWKPTSGSTAILDAQAAPWPINAGTAERSGKSKLPSALENIIAEWNARGAMKKAVQRVAAQASMSNQPQELRNLASPAAPSSGVKTQVKAANSESVSDTTVAQPQKFSHMSFQSSDSGGKLGVPCVINPFGCLGKPADMTVAMSRNDEAATSHVLSNGTGFREKGAKSASAINGLKKLESDDASLPKPAENYIGSEEKRKHAPLASCTAKTAPQPPVRPAATELAATTLADLMNGHFDGKLSTLVQLLRTTADLVEQELIKQSAGSRIETPAAERIADSVEEKANVEAKGTVEAKDKVEVKAEIPSVFEGPATTSTELPAVSWGPTKGTGAALEPVATGTEQTTAISSESLEVSAEMTTARSESDLLDFNVESMNIYDATPPRSPVAGRPAGMVGSEESAQDAENADAVQESELEEGEVLKSEVQGTRNGANAAPADTPANSQAKTQAMLTEGDDFWARAGIKW
jgi:hypothetical protein